MNMMNTMRRGLATTAMSLKTGYAEWKNFIRKKKKKIFLKTEKNH